MNGSAFIRSEFGQPVVGFPVGEVQAGGLIIVACGERVAPELLALPLAFGMLLHGFAHDPV